MRTLDPALRSTSQTGGTSGRCPVRALLILWGAVLVLIGILLASNAFLDGYFWRATRWAVGDGQYYKWADFHAAHALDKVQYFYTQSAPPMNSRFFARTERLWLIFKGFGEGWMVVFLAPLFGIYYVPRKFAAERWLMAGAAALTVGAAGGIASLISLVAGRTRPTHTDAENIWTLFRGFHDTRDLSFPSGHATVAFTLAAMASYLSPRGRAWFVTVAAGTAISRVVMEAHFWSDVIAGAALGWTTGWLLLCLLHRMIDTWAERTAQLQATSTESKNA